MTLKERSATVVVDSSIEAIGYRRQEREIIIMMINIVSSSLHFISLYNLDFRPLSR